MSKPVSIWLQMRNWLGAGPLVLLLLVWSDGQAVAAQELAAVQAGDDWPAAADIPDPIGLGPRLALMDYLRDRLQQEPAAGASYAQLVAQYEAARAAQALKTAQGLGQPAAGLPDLRQRAELGRLLWVEFGVAAADDADVAALAQQLGQLRAGVEQEMVRQREAARAADSEHRRTAPSVDVGQDVIMPTAQLPVLERSAGFARVAAQPLQLDAVLALRRPAHQRSMTTAEIASSYRNAVTLIMTKTGSGTGFFVNEQGLLLTCAHVLPEQGGALGVKHHSYRDGALTEIMSKASLVALDQQADLALVQVHTTAKTISVTLSAAVAPHMGEVISIIGNPGAHGGVLEHSMTQGIISNPRRVIHEVAHIQTNAAVNPGNSGGPMFDHRGNVIGLVVAKAKDAEGLGFAVAHDVIAAFLRRCAE